MTGARIRADLSFRPLRDGLILSMAIGLRALFLVALAAYLTAFLVRLRMPASRNA